MNLVGMIAEGNRKKMKLTVLHRPGGTWSGIDLGKLHRLSPKISGHPKHPEYIILLGHFNNGQTLEVLDGGLAYTATMVTGMDSPELPFVPSFT